MMLKIPCAAQIIIDLDVPLYSITYFFLFFIYWKHFSGCLLKTAAGKHKNLMVHGFVTFM